MLQDLPIGRVLEPKAAEQLLVPFVACGDLSGYDADANYDHGAGVLAPEPPRGRECDDDGDDALAALGICSVAPSSCTVM